jgi:hypothetical protein
MCSGILYPGTLILEADILYPTLVKTSHLYRALVQRILARDEPVPPYSCPIQDDDVGPERLSFGRTAGNPGLSEREGPPQEEYKRPSLYNITNENFSSLVKLPEGD